MKGLLGLTMAVVLAGVALASADRRSGPPGFHDSPDLTGDPAARSAALRAQGLALGYNLDYPEALTAFKAAIAADASDPTPYRLAAGTAWINLLFEQGAVTVDDYLGQARADLSRPTPSASVNAAFHDHLQLAMALSDERLRNQPNDADAHYQVGAAFGVLACYTATVEGRLLASLSAARHAYREHERVLELDPSRKDAGLIVGLYRYTVAALPAPMRLMAYLAGFGGGRERGLRMVEEAARYPSDAKPSALFTLILIYNREARYGDALRVTDELRRIYPRNRLLMLEAGSTALRAGLPEEARFAIEQGLEQLARDERPRARGEEARWRYAHGASLVALNEVDAAERELRTALAGAARDWVRGRTRKELGKLADLAGDRPRALVEYRLADRLCRQDHDSLCADELKPLFKRRYQ